MDVATGSGDFINALMKMLKDYDDFVGIEISEEDLKSAVKRFEGRARASVSTSSHRLKREFQPT